MNKAELIKELRYYEQMINAQISVEDNYRETIRSLEKRIIQQNEIIKLQREVLKSYKKEQAMASRLLPQEKGGLIVVPYGVMHIN